MKTPTLVIELLDATDTERRMQQNLAAVVGAAGILGGLLAGASVLLGREGAAGHGLALAGVLLLFGIVLLVVAGRTLQDWTTSYEGHTIRFTNSPLVGERLYVDGREAARGLLGRVVRLEAPISDGGAAGTTVVATSAAGFVSFRCRITAERPATQGSPHW